MAKVLIVDDAKMIREQVRQVVEDAGHSALEADTGVTGLSQLASNPDTSLIICDVNMPEMDGLTMCERIKDQGPPASQIPIFMLTTESNENLKSRGKAAGVRAWMLKPFNGDLLIMGIKKILGDQ